KVLESIKNQTFTGELEVIIINDGSTEPETLEILNNLPVSIKVINQENQGLSAARNTGIKASTGKWILPLDADDKLHLEYLAKTLNLAESKNLDFVTTWMQQFETKNKVYKTHLSLYDELFNNFLPYCALFSRQILDTEKYDETFRDGFEDWELWLRILSKFKGEVIPEPLFQYRVKAESMLTNSRKKYAKIVSKIRDKHSDLYTPDSLKTLKKTRQKPFVWVYDIYYKIKKISSSRT
ncbi:MAG: glycosyltransferase family 2 protein, partial [Candidatus Peregrinibacteria bacterium]|nr:glycosyltransferase family 2 protein [Candidatus Peregrinibacteria bacterium]